MQTLQYSSQQVEVLLSIVAVDQDVVQKYYNALIK